MFSLSAVDMAMTRYCTVSRIQACGTIVSLSGMSAFFRRCAMHSSQVIALEADRDNKICTQITSGCYVKPRTFSNQSVIGSDIKKIKYINARVVTTIATTACICSLRDQLRRTSTKVPLLADASQVYPSTCPSPVHGSSIITARPNTTTNGRRWRGPLS